MRDRYLKIAFALRKNVHRFHKRTGILVHMNTKAGYSMTKRNRNGFGRKFNKCLHTQIHMYLHFVRIIYV